MKELVIDKIEAFGNLPYYLFVSKMRQLLASNGFDIDAIVIPKWTAQEEGGLSFYAKSEHVLGDFYVELKEKGIEMKSTEHTISFTKKAKE